MTLTPALLADGSPLEFYAARTQGAEPCVLRTERMLQSHTLQRNSETHKDENWSSVAPGADGVRWHRSHVSQKSSEIVC
jgi:hypothetical protein